MRNLLEKFRLNDLTPDELCTLRERINSMTNEELAQFVVPEAKSAISDEMMNESVSKIKNHIDRSITQQALGKSHIFIHRWIVIAASILLPVFLLTTCWLYFSAHGTDNNDISYNVINTTAQNDTKITLSDGTQIKLRRNSMLSYPSRFNKEERKVKFSGAAFFDVASNKKSPFTVSSPNVEITVKGTTFGISAREDNDFTQVTLFEGIVDLTSIINHQTITLTPGTIAKLNNLNGDITIQKMNSNLEINWKKDEIIFHNITPDSLINQIENYYNVKLPVSIKQSLNSNFTGTLPIDDLPTTIKVLNRIYGINWKGIDEDYGS